METNLVQDELDLVEAYVLDCLFGDANSPKVNGMVASFFALQGKSFTETLNASILEVEAYLRPWLTTERLVDGSKISLLIENKFNWQVSIPDFRMIEFTEAFEPMLKFFGKYIQ